jgi:hypothetical protein
VSIDPNGGFDVTGTHTYADEGADKITTDAPLHGGGSRRPTHARRDVVRRREEADVQRNGRDRLRRGPLRAALGSLGRDSWGDGGESAGTLTATGAGTFSVAGLHVYKKKGVYRVLIALNDVGGAANASAQATVTGK